MELRVYVHHLIGEQVILFPLVTFVNHQEEDNKLDKSCLLS